MKVKNHGLRTWIEIDQSAIKHNYRQLKTILGKQTKFCAVVKSNAYGHNFVDFSKEMVKIGANYLAVDSIIEGLRLRKEGIDLPILVLGYTLPERLHEASKHNLEVTISNFDQLSHVIANKSKIKIHIKVDTGMSRQGFLNNEKENLLKILALNQKKVRVVGLYTHLASAKNPTLPHDTLKQLEQFNDWINGFNESDFKNIIIHAAATSGAMLYPQSHFNMARIGIGLYGLYPSTEAKSFCNNKVELKPVLTWKTIVGEVKKIPAGEKIGYDGTEILRQDTQIAICPIGYWHGISRKLSGIGQVLIKGKYARILGRISMDMIAIDISGVPNIKSGEEVILIGTQGKNQITAYDMARLDDTSWYETITRINPLIKRFYVRSTQ